MYFVCKRTLLCAGTETKNKHCLCHCKAGRKDTDEGLSLSNRSAWHNWRIGDEGKEAYLGIQER